MYLPAQTLSLAFPGLFPVASAIAGSDACYRAKHGAVAAAPATPLPPSFTGTVDVGVVVETLFCAPIFVNGPREVSPVPSAAVKISVERPPEAPSPAVDTAIELTVPASGQVAFLRIPGRISLGYSHFNARRWHRLCCAKDAVSVNVNVSNR
ncbi:hypothetical protein DFH07DRAFT_862166 [Mycena maculata]|uniref:Secreted protein n=1 Tax=Mycena maculata TaxID=230809 RepID=A0AAD7MGY7_9AGAR|nr:hypothetical protein DFH07DRAFT_862166 [Mycena maculata]